MKSSPGGTFMEARVNGITYRKHLFRGFQKMYYYGYDEKYNIIMTHDSFDDTVSFDIIKEIDTELHKKNILNKSSFNVFINYLINDVKILNWKEFYFNEHVNDGEEWELIIHYDLGRTKSFTGVNAYPRNFSKFKKICKLYKFGI